MFFGLKLCLCFNNFVQIFIMFNLCCITQVQTDLESKIKIIPESKIHSDYLQSVMNAVLEPSTCHRQHHCFRLFFSSFSGVTTCTDQSQPKKAMGKYPLLRFIIPGAAHPSHCYLQCSVPTNTHIHRVLPSLKQTSDDSFPAKSYIITGLKTDSGLPHGGSVAHRV